MVSPESGTAGATCWQGAAAVSRGKQAKVGASAAAQGRTASSEARPAARPYQSIAIGRASEQVLQQQQQLNTL